jgi:hypothetical protein
MSAEIEDLGDNKFIRFFTDRQNAVAFAGCKNTVYDANDLPAHIHNPFPILLILSGFILGKLPVRYLGSAVITRVCGTDLAIEPNSN